MFDVFSKAVQAQFAEMSRHELYVTDAENLFEAYLAAFPEGTNPMFRKRTEHDCNCCKQFIRRLGGLVNIINGKIITVWDNLDLPQPYKTVADTLRKIVQAAKIVTVFRTKERKYGTEHNYDGATNEKYFHLHGHVADRHYASDPATKRGEHEAIFQVLKRGLTEIQRHQLGEVLDLIESNGLYRGEEHKLAVLGFKDLLTSFMLKGSTDLFVWENLDNRNARFRNTVIGTLLVDLAEGKDFEQAVKSFETKVAPLNYKRPTSVITQKMIEQAVETLTGLGLAGAIQRRYARLSDVSVNDVLFVDNESSSKMKSATELLLLGCIKPVRPLPAEGVTQITADSFIKSILPITKSMEVLVENRHVGNFLSLTGGDGPERLFKWDNNFAWSYDGDVTDSVKQRVKAAGGKVDCKLRVSLSWFNTDDLDLHAVVPHHGEIYFGNKCDILDVDMNAGTCVRNPVENLAFTTLRDGLYRIFVNQFRRRETIDVGFSIEVEFAGIVRQFSYNKAVRGDVHCFVLAVQDGQLTSIVQSDDIKAGSSSQEKWGLQTESLVPVVAVLNSPNHWNEQQVGARHLIFALKNCRNPEQTRGIYNEFLRPEFEKHRKVFEVLGAKSKCKTSEEQISGVGFTQARGDSVTVVVSSPNGRRSYTVTF